MSEQSSSDSPSRGMESIAHLFLSQSRGNRGRIPPGGRDESSLSDSLADSMDSTGPSLPLESEETLSSEHEICYTPSQSELDRNEEDFLMSQASAGDHARSSRPKPFHGVVLWTDHLSGGEEPAVCFARQWAQKNEAVGFVRLDADLSELLEFQADVSDGNDLSTKEWQELLGEGTTDLDGMETSLRPALTNLAQRCDILLIYLETGFRPSTVDLLEYCHHAVVATTPEPNDMLAAYKVIKRVSPTTWEDKDISVFVCDAEDEASARRVYDKLSKTAWDFLGVDLSWGGWAQPTDDVSERYLAAVETREEILEELAEALSPHIEESSQDPGLREEEDDPWLAGEEKSSQGLGLRAREEEEEEEKSGQWSVGSSQEEEESSRDLEFGNREEEEREETFEECVEDKEVSQAEMPTQAWAWHPSTGVAGEKGDRPEAGMTPERGKILRPVGVDKLPRTDQELADALQLALPGWSQGIVTPMVLPVPGSGGMDPAVRFLVDGNGRLFVLGVSLAASEEALTKSLQGRKWLEDNLPMILSSCPQVRIDRSLETGVILVAGGNICFLHESISQIREFPIFVKQLHLLQNETGSSLLVI